MLLRLTFDKLPGIRADLFRLDDEWQYWDFPKLVESLRKWILKKYGILRNMRNANVKMYIRKRNKSQIRNPVYLYIVTNEDIKPVNGNQSVVSRRVG